MIIGFKEIHPYTKEPTNFVDKVTRGVKIHSIREDKKNRYKPGVKLHMSTGVRTKEFFCFDDSKTVVHRQKILIVLDTSTGIVHIDVDRKRLKHKAKMFFISNDGFDCLEDFILWLFPKTPGGKFKRTMFAGVIVHWTAYQY